MDGEKKTERNIGTYKTLGVVIGVKKAISKSEEELMNPMLKVWEKLPLLM
jgi:hypothetical protein